MLSLQSLFSCLCRRPGRTFSQGYLAIRRSSSSSGRPHLLAPPTIAKLETSSETTRAREWITNFKKQTIPKDYVELTFSRSSGPGGQNVNKVNTKATLRCPVSSYWIPLWAREHLKKSPAYVSSSQTLLITSTVHRTQAGNVQECFTKLHSIVLAASSASVVNEASEAQKERVRRLEKQENARRRLEKEKRSSLKRGRGRGDWD